MAMLSVRVHKFEQKAGRKIDFDKKEYARFNKQKVRCYKCQQRGHFARECRAKGGNDKQRYSSFKIKEIGKKEEDLKALINVDTLVDWINHDSKSDGVIAAKEFGMIAGCDFEDAIKKGTAKLYNLITGANSEAANTTGDAGEFALMGVTSEWRNSSKNLFKLIDSSMSVRTKVGLGFTNCIGKHELGWDDSAFSVFTTNSEDVEGRPIFHRFSKTDSMKAMPPPLTGDYTSLSDHTDLDESQMFYDTKSSTSCDPKCVPNNFVSCNDSDKSLKVNTNDFASSDSSVKSLEHQPNDSTSCASTSSVSTSMNEDEIESNACHFRKYASSVSKLCFVCGSGTHLIKDCDFYEKQMTNTTVGIGMGPAVRPQPVPTGKPKVTPVPTGKPKVTPVPTGKPKVKPVPTGKPKVTPVPTGKPKVKPVPTGKPKVTPVPTGKPQVFTPVPTGWPNRPFPVPTDRGCSPSVISGWWQLLLSPQQVVLGNLIEKETPFSATKDEGIFDSGCSRSMTDTECLILSKDFKLLYDSMVVLKVPRKHNLYTINLNDLCPRGNLACLVVHASFDESVKRHRRMAHVNYKNMNRLVKGNLVRGLLPKLFKNGHTCVACYKGKQYKASYKTINALIPIVEIE
nr:ribonuclease H-like domain-containing protein [Tanacetum cinerariifolium]